MESELRAGERIDYVNDDITLIQRTDGLIFGTDALLLAAFVRGNGRERAAELGSGSGIVSLLCAGRRKFSSIRCAEIQPAYAELTDRNIRRNHMEDRVSVVCADVSEFASSEKAGSFDVVFSNPPYLRADCGRGSRTDEKNIARREVCGTIADFCRAAARLLRFGGRFYCVYHAARLCDLLCAMRDAGIEPKRLTAVQAHPMAQPSMILAEGRAGGRPDCRITRPFCLFTDRTQKENTRVMNRLLESGRLLLDE